MSDEDTPRPLTLREAETALDYFTKKPTDPPANTSPPETP